MQKYCTKCKSNTDSYAGGSCKQCMAAYYISNRKILIDKATARYAANRKKKLAYAASYREANPSKAINYRSANKARISAYNSAYYAANTKKYASLNAAWGAANHERKKAYCAAWREANPNSGRIYKQNRSARIHAIGGKLSKGLSEKLFKLQRGKCACCGNPLGDDYHLDHIMPLALGGANTDENIQLLRAKCNLQKSAKHPVEFMQSKGFLL